MNKSYTELSRAVSLLRKIHLTQHSTALRGLDTKVKISEFRFHQKKINAEITLSALWGQARKKAR